MKRMKLLTLIITILVGFYGTAQTQFWSDDFEDSGSPSSGTRTPSITEYACASQTAYYTRTTGSSPAISAAYSGFTNSKFFAAADIDRSSSCTNGTISPGQTITWSGINIAGKTGLSFTGAFGANSAGVYQGLFFANATNSFTMDSMAIEYRINGGAWIKIIGIYPKDATATGGAFGVDSNNDRIGDGTALSNSLMNVSANISGTGTTLDLRFDIFLNNGSPGSIAIDNFRLFETPTCTAPVFTTQPQTSRNMCAGTGTTTFGAVAANNTTAFKWQYDSGSGFTDLSNDTYHSGVTTNTLTITSPLSTMNGWIYRAVAINGVTSCSTNSNPGTLNVSNISANPNQTNVDCNGNNTGAASVSPSGGIGSYTYLWSVGGTSAIKAGLTAGSYSVTITDAASCQKTQNFTITQPPVLNGTTVVTNVACFGGNTGAINLTPSGGSPGYTFNWASGPTTEDRTNLTAGTYSVTITDANNCTKIVSGITLTQPTAAVSGTSVVTNVACFGGNTGAINLTPTGGTGPYTFNWASGPTTEDRTNLTAGTYSVTITDANGCTGTVNITVTQPTAPVSGTTVVTNIACFGGNTGAINLTPTGGVGPYTFNWGGGITSEDRTNLTAGTYSVTITDANGCTGTVSPTVTQPTAPVSGTTVVTNVACFGGNTGAINLTPTGGVGPYTFNWGGGITTEDRTNLTAGTYSVTITDINGCTGTVSPTVTQPTASVSGTTVVTNVACFGGNTGAINLTPTGGVGPYTFNWVGGVTTEDRTSLTAGNYSVTITDANGCTGTVSPISVTQPPSAISGTTVVTNVACFGGNTGAINLTPTGGVGPYTFNWGGGITTEDRTSLTAGTYSVTITDANGCTGTVSPITVTQPASAVSGTTVVTNIACFGGNTGAINLTPTGGTGPYTFNWGGGITSEDRTNLTAGTYSVTITDINGCTGTVSPTVTQPTASVSGTTVVTNIACFGGNTGAINLTPTGGVGPYTFNWGGGVTTEDRTNLTAGNYSVTITDANGCTGTISPISVTQPTAPVSGTTVVTDVFCNGGNSGAINLTPTGGVGPYTFNWVGGITTEDRTNLTAGTYSVTITDANGCTGTVSGITITEPTSLVASSASYTNVSCNGGTNGTASISASGGVPSYTYSWSPSGGTAATATGLAAGPYTVTVTDANGCTATQSFTITEPSAVQFTAAAQTNIACFGESTGAFEVNPATGGTGAFTYDWAPGTPSGDGTTLVTGLAAGTYSVTATDANGCTAEISFVITQPNALVATAASQTDASCNGGSNGTATVSVTGGELGYTYSWTPSVGTTATVNGLTAGTYTVEVTDANGCQTTQDFTIGEPDALIASLVSQTDVSCNGDANGTATIGVTGGTGAYTYSWSPFGGTGATATDLAAGPYTVTVTDANNCQTTSNLTIAEPDVLVASAASQTDVSCNGGTNGSATVSVTGGTSSYTYSWSPAGGTNATATDLAAGTYTVTVTDAHNCQTTQDFTIVEPTALVASAASQTDISCNGGATGEATVNVTGGTGSYTYSWSPAGGTDATATDLTAGTYTVTVTDDNNCQATQDFIITEPDALVLTGSQTDVVCHDGSDGSATVDVTGGVPNYTYSWSPSGGNTATENGLAAGTYVVTVTDDNGCMSTQTFVITEPDVISSTTIVSACGSYTWTDGMTYTTSGTHTQNLTSANGCDSVAILALTINAIPTAGISQTSDVILQASGGGTYQWINCANNTPVAGATAATFVATQNGSYAVVVSNGNCSDTSSCITVDNVGLNELSSYGIMIVPNPAKDQFKINMDGITIANVMLYDAQGKLVKSITDVTSGQIITLDGVERGVYMVNIQSEKGWSNQRLVVQ